jgi:carboxymethylenebutenolidase
VRASSPSNPISVRSLQAAVGAFAAAIFLFLAPSAHAGWIAGEFTSGGKPVHEYHCVPKGNGPHPAVVMLHGASQRKDSGNAEFEKICGALADRGYYTEFIEYYSQTEAVGASQFDQIRQDFPIWLDEIHSGLDALDKNPAVDPHRVALMGFSLGSFLSLSMGAIDPSQIAAIVEYYGALPSPFHDGAKSMPPTLILHGDKDVLVPVKDAHELDELLTKDNRPHEMKIYEGANHGFNFPELSFWYNADDAQDAWSRSVKFLAANLKGNDATAASSK